MGIFTHTATGKQADLWQIAATLSLTIRLCGIDLQACG